MIVIWYSKPHVTGIPFAAEFDSHFVEQEWIYPESHTPSPNLRSPLFSSSLLIYPT